MTAGFDDHVDSYSHEVERSIAFVGASLDYFTRRKADHLLSVVSRLVGDPAQLSALDVGCGVGTTDTLLADRFGRLYAIDEAGDAVARAAARNAGVFHCAGSAMALPFATASLDVAFAICVLHHVDPINRPAFMAEVRRVVRPDGLVVVFEHNARNPLTRLAVSRCPFDEGVTLLTQGGLRRLVAGAALEPLEARHIIFSPVDRPFAVRLDGALGRLPIGAQHYVAARR